MLRAVCSTVRQLLSLPWQSIRRTAVSALPAYSFQFRLRSLEVEWRGLVKMADAGLHDVPTAEGCKIEQPEAVHQQPVAVRRAARCCRHLAERSSVRRKPSSAGSRHGLVGDGCMKSLHIKGRGFKRFVAAATAGSTSHSARDAARHHRTAAHCVRASARARRCRRAAVRSYARDYWCFWAVMFGRFRHDAVPCRTRDALWRRCEPWRDATSRCVRFRTTPSMTSIVCCTLCMRQ
jgi:hypothetical protein